MEGILIKNATLINEGEIRKSSIFIRNGLIEKIIKDDKTDLSQFNPEIIVDGDGKLLFPGVIDDQVHFREPGLTHKGDIYTESKAAIAGGITSFMEMPNTSPQTTTLELLDEKFKIASQKSLANYSFYLGATNDNIKEIIKVNPFKTCGVKVFMGSSTGNMLVDNPESLDLIFSSSPVLIATHCEDESTIKANLALYKEQYGENIPLKYHAEIRSEKACYLSSKLAVELAKKYNSRLHILHLSTGKELELFDNSTPSKDKRITSEVCVHHLMFSDKDYDNLGWRIKWNPSIKKESDRIALINGLKNNRIDIVATDHAPHLINEKDGVYTKSASGGPLVQHSLIAMIELSKQGYFPLTLVPEKMSHLPAEIFNVQKRGYVREGYIADLVLVDSNTKWVVNKDNILYKCGWSPFEGYTFSSRVSHTIVNGRLIYDNGKFDEALKGMPLEFNR